MNQIRKSLFAKIFTAIAATAVLVVMVMALMVAILMREGFAQYLLKGELARSTNLRSRWLTRIRAAGLNWLVIHCDGMVFCVRMLRLPVQSSVVHRGGPRPPARTEVR